jgi:hypothetical protein
MIIEILNGRIFLDGKETINPELIGYAVLDYAENSSHSSESKPIDFLIDESEMVDKYNDFIKENTMRSTFERKALLELLAKMPNNFVSMDFVKKGTSLNIAYPTCYNFLNSAVDAGIIEMNPKTYSFVVENKSQNGL